MWNRVERWLRIPSTLCLAAVLVGVAIVWDGSGARLVNGVGGIVWLACGAAQVRALTYEPRRWLMGSSVLAATIILAVVVRPSDGGIAILGFGAAGAGIAFLATRSTVAWAVLVPALWLPVHLAVAITKSVVREISGGAATIRTDPPPTTAAVPALMVLAAWGAATLVVYFRRNVRRDLPAALDPHREGA